MEFFWAARILGENPHPLTNVGLVSIGAIAPATPTSQPTRQLPYTTTI